MRVLTPSGAWLLKCQEIQSDVYKMHEKAWRPRLCPGPGTRWGAYSAPSGPLADGQGADCPSPRTLPPLSAFQASPVPAPNFQTHSS